MKHVILTVLRFLADARDGVVDVACLNSLIDGKSCGVLVLLQSGVR